MNAVLKQSFKAQPRLSAKNAAKFFDLNGVDQYKLLHDQKYPRQAPQVFKQPYYAPPMKGIRDFYGSGHKAVIDARSRIASISTPSRREHCNRVLDQFLESDLAKRQLTLLPMRRYARLVNSVEFRLPRSSSQWRATSFA